MTTYSSHRFAFLLFLAVACSGSTSKAFVTSPDARVSAPFETESLSNTRLSAVAKGYHHGNAASSSDTPKHPITVEYSEDDADANMKEMFLPLLLKMEGVLAIKLAKDVVQYPPMFFDKLVRRASNKPDEMSPFVMLAKLLGVLLFKTVHDALYYPMIWLLGQQEEQEQKRLINFDESGRGTTPMRASAPKYVPAEDAWQ